MKMLPIPLDKSQLVTRLRPYRKVEANELFELVNAAIQRQQTPAHPAEIAAMAFEAGRKWGVMQAFDMIRTSREVKADLAELAAPDLIQ
jgi:hypothetical protein